MTGTGSCRLRCKVSRIAVNAARSNDRPYRDRRHGAKECSKDTGTVLGPVGVFELQNFRPDRI